MAATVRSVGQSSSGTGTVATFTAAMPAGFQPGDLLIGVACNGAGAVPATRPAGSATVRNIADGAVFNMDVVRKVAVGGDVFTWTVATACRWAGAVIAVNVATYDPVTPVTAGAENGAAVGTTAATLTTTPSITPPGADTLLIAAFGQQSTATWTTTNTAPSMTEVADVASSGTAAASLAVFASAAPPAASAITRSATATVSSANGGSWIAAVSPAPAITLPPFLVVGPRIVRSRRR